MHSLTPATRLLRQIAVVDPQADRIASIQKEADCIDDWLPVIQAAESHGLAPLLHRHLKTVNVSLPTQPRIMLAGLVARHRQANATLSDALQDIGAILEQNQLPFICLKGIALAHIIYPEPALRPMSDIDILVPQQRAEQARAALVSHGFTAQSQHSGLADGRFMRHHHHLPEVTQMRNGMQVTIEIHTDAISGDSPGHLRFDDLTQTPQQFHINDSRFQAMNHIDMLTHLIRHALQPCDEIKLGSVCDIVSYADCYHDQIDFEELSKERPWVFNGLSLMHYVSTLPDSLKPLHPTATPPQQAGFGMLPLGTLLRMHGNIASAMRSAFLPPDWWIHAWYGVPASESVSMARWTAHFPTVLRWLSRRLAASLDRSSGKNSQITPSNPSNSE